MIFLERFVPRIEEQGLPKRLRIAGANTFFWGGGGLNMLKTKSRALFVWFEVDFTSMVPAKEWSDRLRTLVFCWNV